MVHTLEYPFHLPRPAAHRDDPLRAYEARFGALPAWFDELEPSRARSLARQAMARGVPLAAADYLD